jgi:hypothetical protein
VSIRRLVAVVAGAAALALGFSGTAYAGTITVSATPTPTTGFDGMVYATAYYGTTLYVGGDFTNAVVGAKKYPRARLAAVNTLTGALLPWTASADATVRALAVDQDSGTVYAGGSFTIVNGQQRTALAALDPATGALSGFNHAIAGTVRALGAGTGHVYAAGRLTSVDGMTASNVAAFDTLTGMLDPLFQASTDDVVDALVATSNRVYLGGLFKLVDGQKGTPKLVALDPLTGARDLTFKPTIPVRVFGIAVGPNGVYTAMGGQGGRAIAFGFDGTPLWTTTADGDVQAVAVLNDVVYLGGHFDNVCASNVNGVQGTCVDGSVWRVKLAAVDAVDGTLLPWDPHANGINGVTTLTANSGMGTIVAGGEFTTMGGLRWPRLALFGYPGGMVRTAR